MTDKLIPFTFKDTGIEIALKPVSQTDAITVVRQCRKPLPPLEHVQNGDGSWRDEPNYDADDYVQALQDYQLEIEERLRRFYIKRGVVLRLTDEQKAEVEEYRQYMREDQQIELDPDDKFVYVNSIAMGTNYQDFLAAVQKGPTDPKSTSG